MKRKLIGIAAAAAMLTSLAPPAVQAAAGIDVGEYVQMGAYYGEPILWRCVDIDENGPLMLSDKIICIKPFDAVGWANTVTGSHSRNTNRQQRGSNCWSDSNIRSWLNSDASAGNIEWLCGNPPDENHVSGGYNEYDKEAGFLTNFTTNEVSAIKEISNYNCDVFEVEPPNYDTAYTEYVNDKVFLLDTEQVYAFRDNANILGEDYFMGMPTEQCIANNENKTTDMSTEKNLPYWLRTPNYFYHRVQCVYTYLLSDDAFHYGYNPYDSSHVGVRPAFYLNLQSAIFKSGSGTEGNPYTIEERGSAPTAKPTQKPASTPSPSVAPTTAPSTAGINTGDYVQMGTYYGKPILWRCVDKDDNGSLMLADKIICIKTFDAKGEANIATGSHSRYSYRQSFGSNYWGDSNMRSWLNSDASAGNVNWLCGNPPDEDHVWSGYNEYDKEAGFLTNFTQDELNAVKELTQKSLLSSPEINAGMATTGTEPHTIWGDIPPIALQNYDTAYAEYVTDKMFLLDVKQVNAVYQNRDILGKDYYIGEPTAECVANSEYKDGSTKGYLEAGKKWYSWLRSSDGNDGDYARVVYPSGTVNYGVDASFTGVIGVRPAFYMNDSAEFISGDGKEENPYLIDSYTEEYFTATPSNGGATVENVSGRTQTATVIVSDYTGGVLTDIHTQTETFSAGQCKQFSYGRGTEHKIFVWDSLSGMRPLTK